MKIEVPMNFLIDLHEKLALRPTDVVVYKWVREKHACVDLTHVSPLMGLSTGGFSVEETILEVTISKMVKHEKMCFYNQHVFISFAFLLLVS